MDGWTDKWTDRLMDGRTDGNIILPLRELEPVAYGRMRWAQLRATRFYFQKAMWKTSQRYRETERQTYKLEWNPLGSFGPQCGDNTLLKDF